MIHIFTNIHRGVRFPYANENRHKVLHAETKEEARNLVARLTAEGVTVYKTTTSLGYPVSL